MAVFSTSGISIKGIAASVPANKISNRVFGNSPGESEKLITTLGIEERRVAMPHQCASDLCIRAAQDLLPLLGWNASDIDALFFVTQTPDYLLPGTSMHLQQRLGIPDSCAAFDINQGCAGYIYGLSLAASFLSATRLKRCLLLVGDTITKWIAQGDQSLGPLFSDAGTATALEWNDQGNPIFFNLTSRGTAHEAIIVKGGGGRHPYNQLANAAENQLSMKGLEVFNFSLSEVVPNVEELLRKTNVERGQVNQFVFHQANQLIVQSLARKLNLLPSQVPLSLKYYGNTSGASIPLTLVNSAKSGSTVSDGAKLLCGFGVGLSLASALLTFNNVQCPPISELK